MGETGVEMLGVSEQKYVAEFNERPDALVRIVFAQSQDPCPCKCGATCAPAEGRVLVDAVLPAKLPNLDSGGLGLPHERTIGSAAKRFFVCKLSVAKVPSGLTDFLATNYRLRSRPLRIAQERRSGPRVGSPRARTVVAI